MIRRTIMNYAQIRDMDIVNGQGIAVSLFVSGCPHHCKGCFNAETWDFNGGKEFNDEVINHIIELCGNEVISGLSILGGEPLNPKNIEGSTKLAKIFKEKFPNKTIWLWSGYLFDDYIHDKEIVNYIDVIVDGQFKIELSSPLLKYKGSSNQRVIDVKKTLKSKKIVLYEE
jgi:anaerobic ribonucleoside-triphosphate reductase activating protein